MRVGGAYRWPDRVEVANTKGRVLTRVADGLHSAATLVAPLPRPGGGFPARVPSGREKGYFPVHGKSWILRHVRGTYLLTYYTPPVFCSNDGH